MPAPRLCPVPDASQKWLDEAFPRLIHMFGKEQIRHRKVLVPTPVDFPVRYNGDFASALHTLQIIAAQMDVVPDDIVLDLYEDHNSPVTTGSPCPGKQYPGRKHKAVPANMRDWARAEDAKYYLWLNKRKLRDPEGMAATLAHEMAHIKLQGEGRLSERDEKLTDLVTVVFGVGIFNANVSYREERSMWGWAYGSIGFLSQREWGYALALFARLREEKDPDWIKHLTKNLRSDFAKSQAYLEDRG